MNIEIYYQYISKYFVYIIKCVIMYKHLNIILKILRFGYVLQNKINQNSIV
jgi:hypothetical protein